VAAGFRVRRIKSEHSIGDKLKRARTRQKISIAEVEEATKIRSKFILALEADSWEMIPSEVYGRGYLETYSHFLHLSREEIMKQYERERSTYARHCQSENVELAPASSLPVSRFLLTPRFLLVGSSLLGLVLIGGIVGFQIKKFVSAPYLELVTPVQAAGSNELFISTESLTLSGRTSVGAAVTVNGKPVVVQEDGNFSATLTIQKGVNAVLIQATNLQGKTTSETLSVTDK